jgi:hypothetical protein
MLMLWLVLPFISGTPIPDDDLVGYDWEITESNTDSNQAVYVIPPIIISDETI